MARWCVHVKLQVIEFQNSIFIEFNFKKESQKVSRVIISIYLYYWIKGFTTQQNSRNITH